MQNDSSRTWLRPLLFVVGLLLVITAVGWWLWEKFAPPKPFGKVVTLAGAGAKIGSTELSDPFGVAADGDDIYVTDGMGGKLFRVSLTGKVELITDQLDMPSHLAVAPDGKLIVANTGAHTIVKVDPDNGNISVIAGTPNVSGNADGKGAEAKFNAQGLEQLQNPVGQKARFGGFAPGFGQGFDEGVPISGFCQSIAGHKFHIQIVIRRERTNGRIKVRFCALTPAIRFGIQIAELLGGTSKKARHFAGHLLRRN